MVDTPNKWQTNADYAIKTPIKHLYSNHPDVYVSLFANLQKIEDLLNAGNKLSDLKVGFLRPEGHGVFRIGQTKIKNAKECRLYILPLEEVRKIYILSAGGKQSSSAQSRDIATTHKIAQTIRSNAQPS